MDFGGVQVVEAGPLGGVGALPTGFAGEPPCPGRKESFRPGWGGYSMTWHRPGVGRCLGVMPGGGRRGKVFGALAALAN